MEYLIIFIGAVFVNNIVLAQFLGICPFLGVSRQVETAMGMGMAVTFVMTMASLITFVAQRYILELFGIEYMQTIVFILVIASLVQLVEMVIQKTSFTLYQSLGVYLPLITTNCAVLGLTILNIQHELNLIRVIVHAVGAAIGFSLAIILFAAIRERIELADVPVVFKGFPIALITAGLMSLAFMGFMNMV